MSNRIFLACRHHPTIAESFLIGDRPSDGSYVHAPLTKLQRWLDTHARCGGTFDHFTIAYVGTRDTDLVPTARAEAEDDHSTVSAEVARALALAQMGRH